MALQASGPIKWSEIIAEFGNPASNTTVVSYTVPWVKWTPQTAWVKSSLGGGNASTPNWGQFLVDYGVYPSNTDPLIGGVNTPLWHTAIWRIGGGSGYGIVQNGSDNATVIFYTQGIIAALGSTTFYYNCQNHTGMSGSITMNATSGATQTFTIDVTNSGNTHYVFTGSDRNGSFTSRLNGNFTFNEGDIIKFNVNASGHNFLLKTAIGTGVGNQIPSYQSDGNAGLPIGTYRLKCMSDNQAKFTWNSTYLGATTQNNSEDTFTTFTITNNTITEHYLTVSINNHNDGSPGAQNWNTNPAGVAWELLQVDSNAPENQWRVIRRSSDSFNYDHASTGWGTLLNTYAVYPSATNALTDTWHETTYLFTPSAGTHTIEAVADSQSEFYLDDGSGETSVLTTNGNEDCSIGSCNSASLGTLSNQTYKLRVRVYNGSQTPNIYGTNSWFNPGGVGFIIKNSSGTIIKSSLDTGFQGSIVTSSGSVKFGNYRMDNASEFGGMIVPLDTDCGPDSNTDIPTGNNPISFSNFYNSRLNIGVDYFTADENRPDDAVTRFGDPAKRKVVGGFIGFPVDTSGSKVAIVVNKTISGKSAGVDGASVNECSLRTGSGWIAGTKVSVQVGANGRIYGAGGDGGAGGDVDGFNQNPSDGSAGENGTSALGVEYNNTFVKVRSGGIIISGFGGGGGGGGAFEDSTPGESEYKPRCGSGGGGGGGAGSPAGSGGEPGEILSADMDRWASPGDAGSAGSVPNGGEQSGAGGSGNCNPPTGSCEAKGGTGGRGRDEETTGTGFDNDGTGQVSQGRRYNTPNDPSSGNNPNYVGSVGGAKGTDGAAIRRTSGYTVTITNDGTIYGETIATGVS